MLEIEGIAAASAAELKNRTCRRIGHAQQGGGECCFLCILLGRGDQRPPLRKIAVKTVPWGDVAIMVLVSLLNHSPEPNAADVIARLGPELAIGGAGLMPCAVPALREASYIGSLTEMFHRVADHANEPDRRCHRRIPARIDNPIQLLSGNALQITQGEIVNCTVIIGQQLSAHPDSGYCARTLPVSSRPLAERQPEPLSPFRPRLFDLRQVGDMIVLDATEVPNQPG